MARKSKPEKARQAKKRPMRLGVWLIGAHGGLSTTLMVGTRMIARGLVTDSGLLTETPDFAALGLPPIDNIHFGGHDVREATLYDSALEIPFFVEANALCKLIPQTRNVEAGYLETFDAARDRIHETARKIYSQSRKDAYLLAAVDF